MVPEKKQPRLTFGLHVYTDIGTHIHVHAHITAHIYTHTEHLCFLTHVDASLLYVKRIIRNY